MEGGRAEVLLPNRTKLPKLHMTKIVQKLVPVWSGRVPGVSLPAVSSTFCTTGGANVGTLLAPPRSV